MEKYVNLPVKDLFVNIHEENCEVKYINQQEYPNIFCLSQRPPLRNLVNDTKSTMISNSQKRRSSSVKNNDIIRLSQNDLSPIQDICKKESQLVDTEAQCILRSAVTLAAELRSRLQVCI